MELEQRRLFKIHGEYNCSLLGYLELAIQQNLRRYLNQNLLGHQNHRILLRTPQRTLSLPQRFGIKRLGHPSMRAVEYLPIDAEGVQISDIKDIAKTDEEGKESNVTPSPRTIQTTSRFERLRPYIL
ncbi:hypothetical protein I7I51_04374 [Histoplasma capsulatum]|uniref:Uncharacterized protein n=1 Tax=Ajellomyces capsulatus TaxID=5037 RepID=A0A8A1MDG4_AJECA|nr:hypothetical protein I7I51_04374 [Histoplasma capsulatum]